jgi:hypothetical protein
MTTAPPASPTAPEPQLLGQTVLVTAGGPYYACPGRHGPGAGAMNDLVLGRCPVPGRDIELDLGTAVGRLRLKGRRADRRGAGQPVDWYLAASGEVRGP